MKRRAIIFQSGGSTAVINQSLAGVVAEARRSRTFSALYGSRFGVLGLIKKNWVDLTKLSPKELDRLKQTPSSALGSSRHKLSPQEAVSVIDTLRRSKIDTVFFIGGNDSAETGLLLSNVGARGPSPLLPQIIGIPKTIDNDLPGMDHAPGYGSAARFMAIATQEASLDTKAIRFSDPIKIIETMGRNSGWIVAAAALGKRKPEDGPHLLYFPERPFDEKQFLDDVRKIYRKCGFCVIVISETIRDAKGRRIGSVPKVVSKDQFGHPYIEGAAAYLCNGVKEKLGVRARFDKPGTIQRMSMPYVSTVDQREAYQCGCRAVRFAIEGLSGIEVVIKRVSNQPYRVAYSYVPLEVVAGKEKKLPDEFINNQGNFVTPAFFNYALPLIGKALPKHLSLV